mmetsp:Transcript_11892/g.25466  ORF Transcript_11892/g.25466 Transcript_11892/m.25466 type:complete len:275 (+) Transcript_11892:901-1725(+)
MKDTKRVTGWMVLGALLFGTGWGLSGVCPGVAVSSLGRGVPHLLLFSMGGQLVGILAGHVSGVIAIRREAKRMHVPVSEIKASQLPKQTFEESYGDGIIQVLRLANMLHDPIAKGTKKLKRFMTEGQLMQRRQPAHPPLPALYSHNPARTSAPAPVSQSSVPFSPNPALVSLPGLPAAHPSWSPPLSPETTPVFNWDLASHASLSHGSVESVDISSGRLRSLNPPRSAEVRSQELPSVPEPIAMDGQDVQHPVQVTMQLPSPLPQLPTPLPGAL